MHLHAKKINMAEDINQAVELQVMSPDEQRTKDTTTSQVINVPIDQVEKGSSCCLR